MRQGIKWTLVAVAGGFFLLAGVLKLRDPGEFAQSIVRYRIIGPDLAWIVALWLPWLEVVAAAALLSARWRAAGCGVLLGMLGVFELALASAALRGLDIDCGCLGSGDSTSVTFALGRNLVLIGMLLLILKLERPAR